MHNTDARLSTPEGAVTPIELPTGGAKFDLTWTLTDGDTGRLLDLEYRTALFDRASAERFVETHLDLLNQVAQKPEATVGEISRLTTALPADDLDFELSF